METQVHRVTLPKSCLMTLQNLTRQDFYFIHCLHTLFKCFLDFSIFHLGYLKLIVTIYHISLACRVAVRLMFPMKEKTCELTDLAFPMCISNSKSNLIFVGTD